MTPAALQKTYVPGSSVWQELTATSSKGLATFYRNVLGWELSLDGSTGVFTQAGEPVASLSVDPLAGPAGTGWQVYLGADDVPAALLRAEAAGATVIKEAHQLPVSDEAAVLLRDPEGTIFGIVSVEAARASLPSLMNGHLALVDVMTHDLTAATAFQAALFPENTLVHVEEGLSIYRDADGRPLRGINVIQEELHPVLPPHWLAWFVVADQAAAAESAQASGGSVNVADQPIAFGRWSVVVDPSGAAFKALELDRAI
ncbi:VOC family protein [Arthrobacter methylotrophus]|uniref:VOC family protein n=1 Tax=Arthrobacter methylotrophus TaxID=121291 RepID=A0ABV5UM51_9MICC